MGRKRIDEISVRRLAAEGLNAPAIAIELGVTAFRIHSFCRNHDIELRMGRRVISAPPREALEQRQHLTIKQIAGEYGVYYKTVSGWLEHYDIAKAKPNKRPAKEELAAHVGKSRREIAIIYNVSPKSVSNWLRDYGIVFEWCKRGPKGPFGPRNRVSLPKSAPISCSARAIERAFAGLAR